EGNGVAGAIVENGREFEIDDAKPTIRDSIGDIAEFAVFMSHPVFFKFGKQFDLAFWIELVNPAAAIGGHNLQRRGISLQQLRDKGAAAFLQVTKDSEFMVEPLPRQLPAKCFVSATIDTKTHRRARRIFHFMHDRVANSPVWRRT